jgi:hypothetical protein
MRDDRDREPPDTERGARLRACRRHGHLLRPEGRTADPGRRLPAPAEPDLAETRAEKIERLRRAVAEGTYRPDAWLVARAVLAAGAV